MTTSRAETRKDAVAPAGLHIRRATASDLQSLVRHALPEFRRVAPGWIDPAHAERALGKLLLLRNALVLVAEAEGRVVGGVAVLIAPSLWSDEVTAEELVLFTAPEHRRSGVAQALMGEAIAWARHKGATVFAASAECDLPGGREVFEGMGFVAQELKLARRIGDADALLQ